MRLLSGIALIAPLLVQAQPPEGYYDPAAGLSGEDLRAALQGIIDNHNEIVYNNLWSAFGLTDRKPNSKVWDMYSDDPTGTPDYEYSFTVDQCGTANGEGDCFNREHSFPQSWFNSTPPMNSDLFHLYPTDGWVNEQRNNLAYGEVGNASWTSSNGGKLGSCNYPGCSGTVFEPIDAYKGDLARSYFYLLTRYRGSEGSWSSPMMLSGSLRPWAEAMLLSWHLLDPVSQKEIDRNNRIFISLQFNRNPFIDNPQWVQSIWGPTAAVNELESEQIRIWMAGDVLNIVREHAGELCKMNVMDARGAVVHASTFTSDLESIALSSTPGLYLVVLDSPSGRHVQRIVID